MTVILVNEDNHGLLTVAKDYKSAVKFLIDNGWIKESMEIWDENGISHNRLDELLGEDVLDIITEKWDIDSFNTFWDGSFLLNEVEIYE
jgi:hypothetical protein